MTILLQLVLGYLYSHVLEYFSHKLLHQFKAARWGLLASHWRKHHVNSKRYEMADVPSGAELLYISLVAALHIPLGLLAPWAYAALLAGSAEYLYKHWRSHLDMEWALKHLPWHVEHHLGNQHKNWGVRSPLLDKLLGTYEP